MTSPTQLNQNGLRFWLALWHTPGIGPIKFAKLLLRFPDLSELFKQSTRALVELNLSPKTIQRLKNPKWDLVEETLTWAEQKNHYIICWQDPHYPARLSEVYGSPPLLYVKGRQHLLTNPQIAIVGSRNPTISGYESAKLFARELANLGLCVTSGLAHGIDTASHMGALSVHGDTIAVLGSSIDEIYPRANRNLANEISEAGALISEFPLGTKPQKTNFPRRNRIISGLSLGVLVVEATKHSGSLITARYAIEQGREVFAIPGSIHNPLAKGCHALIQAGGKLVETISHVTEELNIIEIEPKCHQKQKILHPSLDIDQQKLVKCIGYEVTEIDIMIARSSFTAAKITAMLPMLEIQGYVRKVSGGYMRV